MKRSFIVYTNNSEKYIAKVIESILDQIQEDEQLIIVDDRSTDNTIPLVVGLVGYLWEDEEHYKLYINTKIKGKKESVEMAKKIATGDFKFIVNKHKRINLGG